MPKAAGQLLEGKRNGIMGTDVVPIDELLVSSPEGTGRLTLNVHLPPTPGVCGHMDDEGQTGKSWGEPDKTFFRRQVNHPDPTVESLHTVSCKNEVANPGDADEVDGPPTHPDYILMVLPLSPFCSILTAAIVKEDWKNMSMDELYHGRIPPLSHFVCYSFPLQAATFNTAHT